MDPTVIYCDNHLLVVVKPAGLLTQGDRTGDPCLLEISRAWVQREFGKPGHAFLGLVHRLDRPVAGVLVFARTSKSAARLSAQLRERRVIKVYEALVEGVPRGPFELETTLDGKDCRLSASILETGRSQARLEVRPSTGRKHQIRRQLAGSGHPIIGDTRYGAHGRLPNRCIALAATAITIEHPTRREPMTFEAAAPDWWPPLR